VGKSHNWESAGEGGVFLNSLFFLWRLSLMLLFLGVGGLVLSSLYWLCSLLLLSSSLSLVLYVLSIGSFELRNEGFFSTYMLSLP
jgi:hypothetical protein